MGAGNMERFLFNSMIKRAKTVPTLHIAMVFDYHRSRREIKGDSAIDMMKEYAGEEQLKRRVTISFCKQSISAKAILGEIKGVHHQKIALFDDTVIMGGANLSHNYFTNRRDRYLIIKECG
jgi:CDP-diacylglycerol--glycerol-3-phosphate 3-phosphatidyltransferase